MFERYSMLKEIENWSKNYSIPDALRIQSHTKANKINILFIQIIFKILFNLHFI